MFFEQLNLLSANDIRNLAASGIPASRVSDWRKQRRLPTRSQALAFATIRKVNFIELEQELTLLELEKDAQTNSGFAELLERAKGGMSLVK